ncbi:UPF0280 family protein [bacterium]|nr:UPF0280 family protein [bacterium]
MKYNTPYYRDWIKEEELQTYNIKIKQTDLLIRTDKDCREIAERKTREVRRQLEDYIEKNPIFAHTFAPYPVERDAPEIVRLMAGASIQAGIGPMAAVAGAIAELVGKELVKFCQDVIVENGGDIFIKCSKPRIVGLYAGENSPFTNKIGILVNPDETPLGICTSSGTVGPSFSMGEADAVVAITPSCAVADAFATALANLVRKGTPTEKILDKAKVLRGIIIAFGGKLVVGGKVNLVPLKLL